MMNRFTVAATIMTLAAWSYAPARAQSISELESKIDRFRSEAQSLYRFDAEAQGKIWEAYCGRLDPSSSETGSRFAAEIGQTLQQQEHDKIYPLLSEVGPLAEAVDRLQKNAETRDKAGALLETLRKEEKKLQRLDQGVVLTGSNHPFTQFAIEYGKKEHKKLCDSEGEQPKICDKSWPGLSGRPDLVFVDTYGLWIYEFKPDNSAARSDGERQVRGYVDGINSYFQRLFPKGRSGGFSDTPDSEHGGRAIVEKLKETARAWSSDGSSIQAQWKVVTYPMCEERS